MKKLTTLAVLTALGLAGCDSDSDPVVAPTPETPAPEKRYANLDVQPEINMVFDGQIRVYLGPFKPCGFKDGVSKSGVKSTSHPYCTSKLTNNLTVNDSKYLIDIAARDINTVLGESLTPAIYQSGQYSMLDVLYYIHKTRSDFQMHDWLTDAVITDRSQLLDDFDAELGTYRFKVSWDRNGDGNFDANDNVSPSFETGDSTYPTGYDGMGAEDNYLSPHWYGRFTYYAGEFLREGGSSTLETVYDRLDEFMVKNNTYLRFESFDPAMTERREEVQRAQVDRKNRGEGPLLQVDFNEAGVSNPIFMNGGKTIDALKAYDLRTDVYQPGVLTAMDAMMVVTEEDNDVEVGFSFWPTLSTDANVGNYAIHRVNHKRTEGISGWAALRIGELKNLDDFFTPYVPYINKNYGDHLVEQYAPTLKQIMAMSQPAHPMHVNAPCGWMHDVENGDLFTAAEAALCLDEWGNPFGGTKLHQMPDAWLINYPPEVISMKHVFDFQVNMWNATEKNNINWGFDNHNDVKYPIYDLSSELVAPMNETHFGWGIADCGLCHSLDSIHTNISGDSPALPEQVQPHYCASCHGSNGAPEGHGEIARCFWCHSKDKAMANHGDATMRFTLDQIECRERATPEYQSLEMRQNGDWDGRGTCAFTENLNTVDPADLPGNNVMKPHDQAGNYIDYPASQTTQGNSDWHTSTTMPDPYSCLTCHANPKP